MTPDTSNQRVSHERPSGDTWSRSIVMRTRIHPIAEQAAYSSSEWWLKRAMQDQHNKLSMMRTTDVLTIAPVHTTSVPWRRALVVRLGVKLHTAKHDAHTP
eukprot:6885057-Karenia_brevis.AAC.1